MLLEWPTLNLESETKLKRKLIMSIHNILILQFLDYKLF